MYQIYKFRTQEYILNLLTTNGLFDTPTTESASASKQKEKALLTRSNVEALFQSCSKNERDSTTLFNLIESLVSLRSNPVSLLDSSVKLKPKGNQSQAIKIDHGTHISTLHDLAFTLPLRKKMDLRICQNALTLTLSASAAKTASQPASSSNQSLQAADPIIVPLNTLSQVICIPTPEKQKAHFTMVFIRTHQQKVKEAGDLEPIVFGFDETGTVLKSTQRVLEKQDPKKEFILQLLEKVLSLRNIVITTPLPSMFKLSSSNNKVPIHHIVAHVKAKEGYVGVLSF